MSSDEKALPCECMCPDEITHYKKQIDILADYLLAEHQDDFGKVPNGEGATEMAIRLLSEYKKTRQEAREEERHRILGLPCMEEEKLVGDDVEESYWHSESRNDLRRELKEEIKL